METNRHIKKYGSWTDERSEIASGDLKKPYVAYIEDEDIIDWNTQEAKKDYSKEYFTIVVNEPGTLMCSEETRVPGLIEYSVNGGKWKPLTHIMTDFVGDFFPLKIHLRCNVSTSVSVNNYWWLKYFKTGGYYGSAADQLPFSIEGNFMSMVYGEGFVGKDTMPDTRFDDMYIYFGNSGIISAENLVIPDLSDNVCMYMFDTCSSLETGPVIAAPALKVSALESMFYKCGNLRKITCLAEDLSAADALLEWVNGVPSTGTFVKKAGVVWPTGINGIPDGWTVEEV